MAIEVNCVKTGRNTCSCLAVDFEDGTYWRGNCTKHKDGTWSCVQAKERGGNKLRKIPPQLVKALLDVKGRRRPRSKKASKL